MKRFKFLVMAGFAVLFLAGCAAAQGFVHPLVGLPDEGRLLVLMAVTAGVTWLLLKASIVFKVDLSGYANVVTVALAPIVITLIEAGLKLIPPVFDNVVLTIIHLIVLLVGSVGTFFMLQRRAPSLR
jgi:hypothetical protein